MGRSLTCDLLKRYPKAEDQDRRDHELNSRAAAILARTSSRLRGHASKGNWFGWPQPSAGRAMGPRALLFGNTPRFFFLSSTSARYKHRSQASGPDWRSEIKKVHQEGPHHDRFNVDPRTSFFVLKAGLTLADRGRGFHEPRTPSEQIGTPNEPPFFYHKARPRLLSPASFRFAANEIHTPCGLRTVASSAPPSFSQKLHIRLTETVSPFRLPALLCQPTRYKGALGAKREKICWLGFTARNTLTEAKKASE